MEKPFDLSRVKQTANASIDILKHQEKVKENLIWDEAFKYEGPSKIY